MKLLTYVVQELMTDDNEGTLWWRQSRRFQSLKAATEKYHELKEKFPDKEFRVLGQMTISEVINV